MSSGTLRRIAPCVTLSALFAARIAQLDKALPGLFSHRDSRVQIYDLACVAEPQQVECYAALPLLFAGGVSE